MKKILSVLLVMVIVFSFCSQEALAFGKKTSKSADAKKEESGEKHHWWDDFPTWKDAKKKVQERNARIEAAAQVMHAEQKEYVKIGFTNILATGNDIFHSLLMPRISFQFNISQSDKIQISKLQQQLENYARQLAANAVELNDLRQGKSTRAQELQDLKAKYDALSEEFKKAVEAMNAKYNAMSAENAAQQKQFQTDLDNAYRSFNYQSASYDQALQNLQSQVTNLQGTVRQQQAQMGEMQEQQKVEIQGLKLEHGEEKFHTGQNMYGAGYDKALTDAAVDPSILPNLRKKPAYGYADKFVPDQQAQQGEGIVGCMDPNAENYDENATINDDGSCIDMRRVRIKLREGLWYTREYPLRRDTKTMKVKLKK